MAGRPARTSGFAEALIEWHRDHGRHDLPWQVSRTPYRVWVSEVMLQQTQVAAVIPYYNRFLERFPHIRALADAPIDAVLNLWSGLGYYARARHLHRAAVQIRNELRGELPRNFATLCSLPGIGRSTAGAILALSHGERFPILDGNAKRVLARYFGIAGNTAMSATQNRLWELSERCTPQTQVAVYTQAIMDLGSSVCIRRRPLCDLCPLSARCYARRTGTQHELPTPRVSRSRRARSVYMLVAMRDDGSVLLERRPEHGLWGGLWCLPQFDSASAASSYAEQSLRAAPQQLRELQVIDHAFTHFDLQITPLLTACGGHSGVMDTVPTLWYNIRTPASIGLPAPIKTLLENLASPTMFDPAATPPSPERCNMSRTVHCVVLKRQEPGLERPPYPGELGKRIFENVSKEAWGRWLQHQTMLINEYRLTPIEPKSRKFLEAEMEKFFFGAGSQAPEGYQPPAGEKART